MDSTNTYTIVTNQINSIQLRRRDNDSCNGAPHETRCCCRWFGVLFNECSHGKAGPDGRYGDAFYQRDGIRHDDCMRACVDARRLFRL